VNVLSIQTIVAGSASQNGSASRGGLEAVFELEPERCDNVQAAIERTIRPMSWIIHRSPDMASRVPTPAGIVTPRDGSSAPWKSGVSKETYYVKRRSPATRCTRSLRPATGTGTTLRLDYTLEFRPLH
jgi:hypothetical protein